MGGWERGRRKGGKKEVRDDGREGVGGRDERRNVGRGKERRKKQRNKVKKGQKKQDYCVSYVKTIVDLCC